MNERARYNCIYHVYDGLREGLCQFSQNSRVALVFAFGPEDPPRVVDPQGLLKGHEPKLQELYLEKADWRAAAPDGDIPFQVRHVDNLHLSGLVSYGGRSRSVAYQMWFTEHHPDVCSIGPTERFLEHATWMLSQDCQDSRDCRDLGGRACAPRITTSGHVLREYATHAVRDHIVDQRSLRIGWDTRIRIYPTLDTILGISETVEEGLWPRGELVFVEPIFLHEVRFLARFPASERPSLRSHKHVRKLLSGVERSGRRLVSDSASVLGIAVEPMPPATLRADFRGGHGFIRLDDDLVCSFFDGRFHSSNRRAKLVFVEELLLESDLDPDRIHALLRIVTAITHHAQEHRHGATLIIDLTVPCLTASGQHFQEPPDLTDPVMLDLTMSLAALDGALHIDRELRLRGFACLLDGDAVPGEDRARGARFNSALRYTARHPLVIAVVVSADRPVSVIHRGLELTARCDWTPVYSYLAPPPFLADYIR